MSNDFKEEIQKKTIHSVIESNVGAILTTLVISFVVGTISMVYTSDKNSQVFQTKLVFMAESMRELKDKINSLQLDIKHGVRDRWTRQDHKDYAEDIKAKLNQIDSRIIRLEDKVNK